MKAPCGLYGWGCALVLALVFPSALAAGFDCSHAGEVVEKAICANATLSRLGARLPALYRETLARDPARAAAIAQDQRNWLAERDDVAWQALSDPNSASDVVGDLTRMYRQRIEFLRHLDRPARLRDAPILRAVLKAVAAIPKGHSDVLKVLQASGLAVLAQERTFDSVAAAIKALPAPPDAALRKALADGYGAQGLLTVAYLPTVGLGGVYSVGGTAACSGWLVFDQKNGQSRPVRTPPRALNACWNSIGYLAMLDGHPVALVQTTGITTQTTALQWQRWLGSAWGEPVRVEVRFAHKLAVDVASCDQSVDCQDVRGQALAIARRYDPRPVPASLADVLTLTPAERTQFSRMETFAERLDTTRRREIAAVIAAGAHPSPQEQLAAAGKMRGAYEADTVDRLPQIGKRVFSGLNDFGRDATYFPARIGGEIVLGRIGHGFIGWREGNYWLVGYWRWRDGKLVPLAGVVVDRVADGVLLAAPVPPRKVSGGF